MEIRVEERERLTPHTHTPQTHTRSTHSYTSLLDHKDLNGFTVHPEHSQQEEAGTEATVDLLTLDQRERAARLCVMPDVQQQTKRTPEGRQHNSKTHHTSLENVSISHCLNRTKIISRDPSHPSLDLLDLICSDRRFRSIKARTPD